jgi:hypothetical protein
MSRKIEDAFNDCFERLLSGESLESCLSRYPEHAAELDIMLRTAFDVKRRVFPVQPRPEFKYWSHVRLQGIQNSTYRQAASNKLSPSNVRRNLAISMAALLVFVIASSGTAAASSDALPDQPLYGVKLAVEQVQITLTPSDTDKAELYANLAEKRAHEIAVMASQGKSDKVASTTVRMYDQLDRAEQLLVKSETTGTTTTTPWVTTPSDTGATPPITPPAPAVSAPGQATATSNATSDQHVTGFQNDNATKSLPGQRTVTNFNKARTAINASAAKSLTILQDALDKAPVSVKPDLSQIIERTKKTNDRIKALHLQDTSSNQLPPDSKANDDSDKSDSDKHGPSTPPVKKKFINPLSDNFTNRNNGDRNAGSLDTWQDSADNGQDNGAGDDTDTSKDTHVKSATTIPGSDTVTPIVPRGTTSLSPTRDNGINKTGH